MPTDENDTVPDDATAQQGATGDVEMTTEDADVSRAPEADETTAKDGQAAGPEPSRITFMTYLSSPVVTLVVGQDETQSLLTAHQGLLEKSPYFAEICRQFVDDGSPRQIELLTEDATAVGSFLEYLYTNEYFPRKIAGQRVLEKDPEMPIVDDTGVHLLRHARVYTLAERYGVPELKKLSSSKIHCIDSTAKGEISTQDTSTRILRMTTPRFARRSRASGLRGRTPCGRRPRTSSRACAWSILNLVMTF